MQVLAVEVLGGNGWIAQQLGGVVDTATLAAGISSFAPIVVAWVTKRQASDRVKALINLFAVALASVAALLINGTDGVPVTWQLVASTFMSGLITSIVAYKGVWKPLNVTPAIANATQNFGVGKPVPAVTEVSRPGDGGVL